MNRSYKLDVSLESPEGHVMIVITETCCGKDEVIQVYGDDLHKALGKARTRIKKLWQN